MISIAKVENDFLESKRQIRELVYTLTPENKNKLDEVLKEIDRLINEAVKVKLQQDGF